ncbi:Fe-S protein assembly chaperone HscA [Candidatus Kinetoplastidibacterium crithidiae]|uniref:Molecular chaperone HscA n=1 Tax=Candidatus Kinetoplastidibacterium crithidiae TCC036E TaxID=1208918 RepID=M1L486_9PROT|nr:Fe-S protein assembly chaperone HscA [Candidatus Kinetoplastibacterium crithidii]AFZ82804.1 molecular chaperone HscA [Candidatus Kinetoplastibacterium crithidii (ex Angomonas deanei ATCC 30255)]AGF47543.1 molecular chaperone HscA [Candidatus Kinetoplastibacterium crithidii TCC036E]
MTLLQISEPENQDDEILKRNLSIGIDLGTTNSLVSFVNNVSEPEIICDYNGHSLIPSIVNYSGKEAVVGQDALKLLDDVNTISSFKRFMGRSIEGINDNFPTYNFVSENNILKIHTKSCNITPVEISADLLSYLKKIAENKLHEKINDAVITVPAYFDERQRQATRDAANLAGLNVLRLLNEPTAAAIAYGLENSNDGIYVVFDLGGGTFDISILKLHDSIFDILSTFGNTVLGGNDFDEIIANYITGLATNKDISLKDKRNILIKSKSIRESLTTNENCEFNIVLENGHAIVGSIDRIIFKKISESLLNKIKTCVHQAIKDSGLNIKEDILNIVMVGGATRMPIIRELVIDIFDKEPLINIDPDKVVSLGAALQADRLVNNNHIENNWLLLDVTPLSLGIETMGGLFEKIIPRNSKIPILAKQEFTTMKNNQRSMRIHVLQGEGDLVQECRSLAYFELNDIPPMLSGVPRIEVKFQIDADGLLQVSARETTKNIESRIVVKPSNGLTNDEVKLMIQKTLLSNDNGVNRFLLEKQLELQKLIETIEEALNQDPYVISEQELSVIKNSLIDAKKHINDSNINLLESIINDLSIKTENFAILRMNYHIKNSLFKKNILDI